MREPKVTSAPKPGKHVEEAITSIKASSRDASTHSKASSGRRRGDAELTALDEELGGLFSKQHNKPQESTIRSINESIGTSKKNSAETSTQKEVKEVSQFDPEELKSALTTHLASSKKRSASQTGSVSEAKSHTQKSLSAEDKRSEKLEQVETPAAVQQQTERKESRNKKKPEQKKPESKAKAKKQQQRVEVSPLPPSVEILRADPPSKQ